MALFASDGKKIVDAWEAEARTSYACLECRTPLKVRRRKMQFPHFYHLKASPSCRLYSKSERHLLIQLHIQKQLPLKESQIEKPFPSIRRIADLTWETKKIVFEIQCSPISQAEVMARNAEYRSLGYEVIWILDDRLFNKKQLHPSEAWIRSHMSYFVLGKSRFAYYDQLEIISSHRRIKKGEKIFVELNQIHPMPRTKWPTQIPNQIQERIKNCNYYLKEDLIGKALTPGFTLAFQHWHALEKTARITERKTTYFKKFLQKYVRDPYLSLLRGCLNRTIP